MNLVTGWERAITPESSVTNERIDMLINWTPSEVRTHPHEAAVYIVTVETATRRLISQLDLFLQFPDAVEIRKDTLEALGEVRRLLNP